MSILVVGVLFAMFAAIFPVVEDFPYPVIPVTRMCFGVSSSILYVMFLDRGV